MNLKIPLTTFKILQFIYLFKNKVQIAIYLCVLLKCFFEEKKPKITPLSNTGRYRVYLKIKEIRF
jgi:hypothetical protein